MALRTNPRVEATRAPPIPEARTWIDGLAFPPDKPLLDVCQAVPGDPPVRALRDHVARLAVDPATARYTDIFGLATLRDALAGDVRGLYGGDVAPGDVAITAGCNQAFFDAMIALAGQGDRILLPTPWYFNHEMTAAMLGIGVTPLPFRPERGGAPDPEDARSAVDSDTRAIVLVTPNNPTGAVYPPDVLDAFFDVARDAGCALVLDETYRDFLPAGARPHDLFARPDWRDTLAHLYSFSKVYRLTGYRVGAIAAGPRMLGALEKVADCVQISAPRLGQEAALYGIRHLRDWRRANADVMAGRVEALRRAFDRDDLAYELVGAGAYFAYVRHPFAERDDVDVARMLARDHGLLALPGSWFGPGQERFLRFAFANLDESAMPAIAERLAASRR